MAYRQFTSPKDFVENRENISVFELKDDGILEEPIYEQSFKRGDLYWGLKHDDIEGDWYLDVKNYDPKWSSSAINLGQQVCTLGGIRYWLECQKCNKQMAILYRCEEGFQCRECLGLIHATRKMNYRSVQPLARDMLKLRQTDPTNIRPTYNGKMTKRAERYEKLRQRVEGPEEMSTE